MSPCSFTACPALITSSREVLEKAVKVIVVPCAAAARAAANVHRTWSNGDRARVTLSEDGSGSIYF